MLAVLAGPVLGDRFGIQEAVDDGLPAGSWWLNLVWIALLLYLVFRKR